MSNNDAMSGSTNNDTNNGINNSSSNNENWCLIESDPAVFTELIELFGCGESMEVMELYSIEDDAMIQQSLKLIPDLPLDTDEKVSSSLDRGITNLLQLDCYGLIFLFEYNTAIQQQHGEMMASTTSNQHSTVAAADREMILDNDDDVDDASRNIFFAQQITNNACATQAILSIIMNTIPNGTIQPTDLGTMLSEFYTFTQELPPYYKGMAITSSVPIRTAHNSFTNTNDTFMALNQFDQQKDVKGKGEAFHFVAYVPVNGIVYELDGLQKQPIVVGAVDDAAINSNTTSATTPGGNKYQWLSVARKAIQDRMSIIGADSGDVKFNLMAVTSNRQTSLQRICDTCQMGMEVPDGAANSPQTTMAALLFAAMNQMQVQEQTRLQYKYENQRRRHNYYNLVANLLKELQRMDQLKKYIQLAKDKQQQGIKQQRQKQQMTKE